MSLLSRLRTTLPTWAKDALRPVYALVQRRSSKYAAEIEYWESRFSAEGGVFKNDHYRTTMLAMAGESDDGFLAGKIVTDFGCGPRGSLAWALRAWLRIGIDVLADQYIMRFGPCLLTHGM